MTSTTTFVSGIPIDSALQIRTATEPFEISQLRAVLDAEHYLKAGRPAGHVLWQGIYEHDSEDGGPNLVAVLFWAGTAKRLKDRDAWIGWDAVTCANRLKLVVQLRRFLVPQEARRPNLASQCLGLALRQLPDAWQEKHGYRPLLAESFHDPAIHQGTLYKVTNWTPLGFTKGFKRHRTDFYQDRGSPKQLWIRPLQKNVRQLLGQPGTLPEEHRKGIAETTCGARSALSCKTLRSLKDAFKQVDDPRNPCNRRHPLSALLGMIAYSLLCGAPDVKAMWAKCGPLNQHQRAAIGLTRRDKKSGLLKLPGYDALNDIINQPTLYAQAQQKLDHLPPAWTSDTESAHGRIEYRELRVAAFDLDTSLFPGARQVASLTRYYQQKHCGEPKQEARHFILSIEEGEATLARLARIGREHWSVENKNHWRRDATRWREDRSVRRKPKGAKNLALLRGATLALIPQEKFSSLNGAFDHYTEHRAEALRLLTQTVPLQCP